MFFRKRKQEISVNLTPLIDVVFLLLIFFMVSTSFTRETQLKVDLPEANGAPMQKEIEVIEISIDKQGRYFVNNRALINDSLETLKKGISQYQADDSSQPLIISADAQAPYQSVVTAMDAAGQLGITNITMATRKPSESQ